MNFTQKTAAGLLLLLLPASAWPHSRDHHWEDAYYVQTLIGAVEYEALEFDLPATEPRKIDHSTLPQLGGAWITVPRGNRFQYGLEATFLLGFQADKVNYIAAGGNGLEVRVSTTLWLFDLAGGAYISLYLDKNHNLRLYGGAGPLLLYADYEAEREFSNDALNEEEREGAFGSGLYARAGLELRIHEYGMAGLGLRGNWARLDFSNIGGDRSLNGLTLFATYTIGF